MVLLINLKESGLERQFDYYILYFFLFVLFSGCREVQGIHDMQGVLYTKQFTLPV